MPALAARRPTAPSGSWAMCTARRCTRRTTTPPGPIAPAPPAITIPRSNQPAISMAPATSLAAVRSAARPAACSAAAAPGCLSAGDGACGRSDGWLRRRLLQFTRLAAARSPALVSRRPPLPGLATTDPATESSTTAGVLPDAHVLFGQGTGFITNMMPGGRVDFGTFLNPTQTVGIGDRFFWLGQRWLVVSCRLQ